MGRSAKKCLWPYSFRHSSGLLQHEKRNDIALNCAATKRRTVVCSLYGMRDRLLARFYVAAAAFRSRNRPNGLRSSSFAASESMVIVTEFIEFESGKGADALERRLNCRPLAFLYGERRGRELFSRQSDRRVNVEVR